MLLAACAPHLRFSAEPLYPARLGTAYSAKVEVERHETPVSSVTLMDGALPPGISLSHDGGTFTLSGTPTAAGRYHATVYVSCYGTNFPGQTANDVIELRVLPSLSRRVLPSLSRRVLPSLSRRVRRSPRWRSSPRGARATRSHRGGTDRGRASRST